MRVTPTSLNFFQVETGFKGHSSYWVWLFLFIQKPWKPNAEGEIRAEHDLQVNSWEFQKLWSFCVVKIAVKSRCYISKSSFIVFYEQPPYKWVQILKVHFTFQVSRLKKIVTEQQAVSVNAHTISFQMVKNGTCYATATKRHFRILDPTKTLK